MTYYYTPLLLRYIGVSRRLHRVYVTHQKSGVNKKKRITHVLFFLKTSFSFLKSRLKKADILGYFHLFIRRLYDSELVFTLLTTYTYYAHKTCTSKKYMCAQSTIIDECKKWASYIFSRVCVKAKGEQSILYLIWHLFTRLSGKRRGVASSHIQKRITQRTLARWQERQSCDDIHSRNR